MTTVQILGAILLVGSVLGAIWAWPQIPGWLDRVAGDIR